MKATICIPTYNQAEYLEASVLSACNQSIPCIVVVSDDDSTDDTARVMRALIKTYPNIKYTRQQANLGLSANHRWLLEKVTTPYVVVLHSDDHLESAYVERLISLMEMYPRAGYAHSAVHEINAWGKIIKQRLLGRSSGYQGAEESLRSMASGYRVAANICLFRTEALRSVGFHKDDMNFAEDWDLAVRLADAGWGNVYRKEVLANYRVWNDSAGYREGRKAIELSGITRVFSESLEPAFATRKWDSEILLKARRKLAMKHALFLSHVPRKSEEYTRLITLLIKLGDCPSLKRRIWAVETGFGPLIEARVKIWGHAVRLVKQLLSLTGLLSRLRSPSQCSSAITSFQQS